MEPPSDLRAIDVPVVGGTLRVHEWGPPSSDRPVLAVHGITASSRSWDLVAAALPGRRFVAPDLRGRGRSADLPAPYGLEQHVTDLYAVLDALDLPAVTLVGHSMGGFVAARLAADAGSRVGRLVLVDGGLPLALPPGVDPNAVAAAVLGPALTRLSMTFPDQAAYREFWRQHPAFRTDWSDAVARYVDYDLVGRPGALRSCVNRAAVEADFTGQLGGPGLDRATDALGTREFSFLRAPLGLQAEPPGLYPPAVLDGLKDRFPRMRAREVGNVNHYTLVLSERGAAAVAEELTGS